MHARFIDTLLCPPIKHRAFDEPEHSFDSMIYVETADLPGGSGGPFFSADGEIVGILLGYKSVGGKHVIGGAKIRYLHELISYHKLGPLMPTRVEPMAAHTDWGPDPLLDRYRAVIRLTGEAHSLRRKGSYRAAAEKCNEALRLVPEYGGALLERSKVYFYYLVSHWDSLTPEQRTEYAWWAHNDAGLCHVKYVSLHEPFLFLLETTNYVAFLESDPDGFLLALKGVKETLDDHEYRETLTEGQWGFLYNIRAQAHHFLGEMSEAEKDYAESIKRAPLEPQWYLNRASFWDCARQARFSQGGQTHGRCSPRRAASARLALQRHDSGLPRQGGNGYLTTEPRHQ